MTNASPFESIYNNCGLPAIYSAMFTNHLAVTIFMMAILMSIDSSTLSSSGTLLWSSHCCSNCSAYQWANWSFRKPLTGLLTDMYGHRQKLICGVWQWLTNDSLCSYGRKTLDIEIRIPYGTILIAKWIFKWWKTD